MLFVADHSTCVHFSTCVAGIIDVGSICRFIGGRLLAIAAFFFFRALDHIETAPRECRKILRIPAWRRVTENFSRCTRRTSPAAVAMTLHFP
ncbi:MAG TPA: hypothetical protein VFP37_15615 [Steroidobacteraceae bacterium]|nr:hypothetical protein [Steroidobacteraceae bacterium]